MKTLNFQGLFLLPNTKRGKKGANCSYSKDDTIFQASGVIRVLPPLLNGNLSNLLYVQGGYASLSVPAGSKNTIDAVFQKPYKNTPFVVATAETDWTDAIDVTSKNDSPTKATIQVYNSSAASANITVHWIAAGILA